MRRGHVPTSAVAIVCAALLAAAVAMASQSLALAGDGAFYLLRIIATGEVFGTQERYLGNLVRQAPALLGVRAGVTDTHMLALLLGAGQIVFVAIVWSLTIALSRADRAAFTAVAGAAGICAGTTWFFSVSEAVLAASLTALVAVLLWRRESWSRADATIVLAASLVLVATYEAAILTGTVLAVWSGWRASRGRSSLERYACAGVGALSVLSVLIAARGIVEPVSPAHSRSLLYFVSSLDPSSLYLAIVGLMAFVAGLVLPRANRARWTLRLIGATALGAAALTLDMSARAAFAARGGASILVLFLILALLADWAVRDRSPAVPDVDIRLLAVPVAFVVVFLAASLSALTGWKDSLDAFREEVGAATEPRNARLVLAPEQQDVLWNWAVPSLSVIVRARPDAGVLYAPAGYVPFEPSEARAQIADAYTWQR